MRKFLTIGELADLLDVNTSLIRYYESQGLLMPHKIDENGYRLYDYNQMDWLETLLLMRKMDIPLKQLKKLLAKRSTDDYHAILEQSLKSIEIQIEELTHKKHYIKKKIRHIEHHLDKKNAFSILEFPKRELYHIHTGNILNYSIKYTYDIMKRIGINHKEIFQDSYIIKENEDIFSLCLPCDACEKHKNQFDMFILPKGFYLNYNMYLDHYENFETAIIEFYKHIETHNLKTIGPLFAWENPTHSDFYLESINHNIQVQIEKP